MNKKRILLCLIILAIVFSSCCVVSAGNLNDVKFNVSSEFKPIEDAAGLQFVDESNNIRIRIFDENKDWQAGAEKYNDTVYWKNSTTIQEGTNVGDMKTSDSKLYDCFYGEYVKYNGKTYWVEVSNENPTKEPNYDKVLECLNYFNEHNSVEHVKI